MEADGPVLLGAGFLRKLGRLSRIINVGDLKLTGIGGTNGRPQFHMTPGTSVTGTMTITTFFTKAADEQPPPAPTAARRQNGRTKTMRLAKLNHELRRGWHWSCAWPRDLGAGQAAAAASGSAHRETGQENGSKAAGASARSASNRASRRREPAAGAAPAKPALLPDKPRHRPHADPFLPLIST